MPTKAQLRATMKSLLAAMSPAECTTASASACDRVAALPEFAAARTIALYAPLPTELDVFPLAALAISQGKAAAIPRTNWATRELVFSSITSTDLNALVLGRLGLREPAPDAPAIPISTIDLLLVPGLAFDRRGNRLGRGAGFYDRLLASPDLRALTVGVGFDQQLVADGSVPVDLHDIPTARICTPMGMITP